MNIPLEIKALGGALLAGTSSLAGAALLSGFLRTMPSPASRAPLAIEPMATWETIEKGRQYFGQSCSHCHGDDATGDEGPGLHNLALSNARIAATIKHGIKGEMPSFDKKYDDEQAAALVSYLRTLK